MFSLIRALATGLRRSRDKHCCKLLSRARRSTHETQDNKPPLRHRLSLQIPLGTQTRVADHRSWFCSDVARNMQSFRHTVKRLEEVSVSCRGIERVQLLRRWLVALREVERLTATCTDTNAKDEDNEFLHDESKDSPTPQPTLIYYVDPGAAGELKNFRDVFLSSLALEGITLSMVTSFV